MKKIIIDSAGASLGRIASYAAKQALLGNNVIVLNCQDALISGRRGNILGEYKIARARGGAALRGPNFPKSPERIMKRTIRGMLRYKTGRGRDAFKRILCYNNTPQEYSDAEKMSFPKTFKINTMTLKELSKII